MTRSQVPFALLAFASLALESACTKEHVQEDISKKTAVAEPVAVRPHLLKGAPAADALAKAKAAGREPKRAYLGPLVQHHRSREAAKSGPLPPLVADNVDSGWIVFVAEGSGQPEIHRIRSDASGRVALTSGEFADYPAGPLPAGNLLAIRVIEPTPDLHLEQLLRIQSSGEIQELGEPRGRVRNPSIAPDGSWVVYESDPTSFRDLYRRDLQSGDVQRLSDNPEGNFEPTVSPDGRQIAFVSSRDGNAEIYIMDADGNDPRRLTRAPGDDSSPSFSPDGRHLLFISDRSGEPRIYMLTAEQLQGIDKEPARRLTGDHDLQAETDLSWSPSGEQIALIGVGERTTSLWVADLPSGNLRRLTDDGALDQGPSWSPNGQHIAFSSNRDGELDIYRVDAEGGTPVRLTQSPGADWLPRWIADSNSFAPAKRPQGNQPAKPTANTATDRKPAALQHG
ncbi:MAG TPA: hypothetical protein ENK31_10705 [Nannocystis exedens]|nr:hypothetical protein [Nannocystis exedens]